MARWTSLPRQAKSDPSLRTSLAFARALRAFGFLPRPHFIQRWSERARRSGVQPDPAAFARAFQRGRHFSQTDDHHSRVAVIRGIPVTYVIGGRTGRNVVLTGVQPDLARLRLEPIGAPRRELSLTGELGPKAAPPHIRLTCRRALRYIATMPVTERGVAGAASARDAAMVLDGLARSCQRLVDGGSLSIRDLDLLDHCLQRLARAAAAQPPDYRRLRASLARRLGVPVS